MRKQLRMAHMGVEPKDFLRGALRKALFLGLWMSAFAFFTLNRKMGMKSIPIGFIIGFMLGYAFFRSIPTVHIARRAKEIETEILFATRFILLKIESGVPLFNALIDAAQSYGVAGKFFQEIVDEINLGKPIEIAVEEAREYSASTSFKSIMSQIVTALKTGADVKTALAAAVDEIIRQQRIQIQEYNNRMNAIVMFYLVAGCVLPSLGVTMLIVLSGFVQIPLTIGLLYGVVLIIAFVQVSFISIIKMIRPTIEL